MPDTEVQMHLSPDQNIALGLPNKTPKVHNPFYDAVELERNGDRKGAERIYLELLNNDFENAVLLAALGMNFAMAEKNGIAHVLLTASYARIDDLLPAFGRLGITPKSGLDAKSTEDFIKIKRSEIENAIGTCWKHENNITEARKWFESAQTGIPPNPDIQNNLGTLYINEGKPADAFRHLDAAIAVDPNHAQAHWNRSLALLESGVYEEGWREYDWGITAKVRVDRTYTTPKQAPLPFWNGEPDANIILYGEQGIGDEIMFSSMIPELQDRCKSVVFECHRKLHKLFCNSFPSIDIYPTREDEVVTWPCDANGKQRYPFTHKLAIGSLGKFFRPDLASFPGTRYLSPTRASEDHWREELAKLPPGPRIGIGWIGGHKKTRVEVRSLRLEEMLPIFEAGKGAQFISLQYTHQEEEIAAFEKKHGIKIHQFPEAAYSPIYDDKAGLVANLDLVITVCTSVVHLAGSMGIPTWVLTPSRPAWRYRLDIDGMPWYTNTVLFRQATDTVAWEPVVAEVAKELTFLLGALP